MKPRLLRLVAFKVAGRAPGLGVDVSHGGGSTLGTRGGGDCGEAGAGGLRGCVGGSAIVAGRVGVEGAVVVLVTRPLGESGGV